MCGLTAQSTAKVMSRQLVELTTLLHLGKLRLSELIN